MADDALAQALTLVRDGVLGVDLDTGYVWRLRSRGQPCEPRRIDRPNYKGYRVVPLPIPGERRIRQVAAHRLVVATTDGWFPTSQPVDHINEDKGDNRRDNLEKVTHSENMRRAYANGRTKGGPPTVVDAAEARRLRATGMKLADIADAVGCSTGHVWRLCHGSEA